MTDTSLSASRDYIPCHSMNGEQNGRLVIKMRCGVGSSWGSIYRWDWRTCFSRLWVIRHKRVGGFINYRIDTLDNYSLPSKGWFLDLDYLVSHDDSVGVTGSVFEGH